MARYNLPRIKYMNDEAGTTGGDNVVESDADAAATDKVPVKKKAAKKKKVESNNDLYINISTANLFTRNGKIGTGQMAHLTPEEVEIFGDKVQKA
jgi:hypothetical protein